MYVIRTELNISDNFNIYNIGYLACSSGWVGKEHRHNCWEIIVPISGTLSQITSDALTNVSDHSIYLIPPNTRHRFTNMTNMTVCFVYIMFDYSFSPFQYSYLTLQSYVDEIEHITKLCNDFRKLFEDINQKDVNELKKHKIDFFSFLTQFIYYLHMYTDPDARILSRHKELTYNVKNYILKNIEQNKSVKEIASHFHISPNHLGYIFKKAEKSSIKQFITRAKMEYAVNLMLKKELSISEISDILGFNSVQYFSTTFKDYYNISPLSYIKSIIGS